MIFAIKPLFVKKAVARAITGLFGDDQGHAVVPVLRGPAKGLRLKLNLIDRLEFAYLLGKYDREILTRLSTIVRPGWTVWDCGIYLGFYTAFFARLVGQTGRVIAFEPDPRNTEKSKAAVKLNGFQNVEFLPVAIGAPNGEVDFLISDDTNSHLPGVWVGVTKTDYEFMRKTSHEKSIRVQSWSLDQALVEKNVPRPDLIKIDIEGAELLALEYMQHITQQARPLIVLELHNPLCDAAAWKFAQKHGYSLQRVEDGTPIKSQSEVKGTLLCRPMSS